MKAAMAADVIFWVEQGGKLLELRCCQRGFANRKSNRKTVRPESPIIQWPLTRLKMLFKRKSQLCTQHSVFSAVPLHYHQQHLQRIILGPFRNAQEGAAKATACKQLEKRNRGRCSLIKSSSWCCSLFENGKLICSAADEQFNYSWDAMRRRSRWLKKQIMGC